MLFLPLSAILSGMKTGENPTGRDRKHKSAFYKEAHIIKWVKENKAKRLAENDRVFKLALILKRQAKIKKRLDDKKMGL